MQNLDAGVGASLLWGAVACYLAAAATQLRGALTGRERVGPVLALLSTSVLVLAGVIAERWLRLGYGPFLTLYEVILSNLFSLGLIYTFVYWRVPTARPGALVAIPMLLGLGAWALTVPTEGSHLPPTFLNPWLWVHVGTGKIFLSVCLTAVGLAGFLLLRTIPALGRRLAEDGDTALLDDVAWRFLTLAFVFHSLMLITGAVWARDAWGRYWAWDPLETWAFATWLSMAIVLHARVTFRVPRWMGWWAMLAVFALAILTFLGVPFLSAAPHKGVM